MEDPGKRIDPSGPAGDGLCGDVVLPAQFYPARTGLASGEPTLRLMAGIPMDAVRCSQRVCEAHPQRRRESNEARFWIFHDNGNGPFSFEDVCETLEVDPHRLRNLIVRWEKDRRSGSERRMIRRSPVIVIGRMQSRRPRGRKPLTILRFSRIRR